MRYMLVWIYREPGRSPHIRTYFRRSIDDVREMARNLKRDGTAPWDVSIYLVK